MRYHNVLHLGNIIHGCIYFLLDILLFYRCYNIEISNKFKVKHIHYYSYMSEQLEHIILFCIHSLKRILFWHSCQYIYLRDKTSNFDSFHIQIHIGHFYKYIQEHKELKHICSLLYIDHKHIYHQISRKYPRIFVSSIYTFL